MSKYLLSLALLLAGCQHTPRLLRTDWGQEMHNGLLCYNYYTPRNAPVGCVAVATAQVIQHYTRICPDDPRSKADRQAIGRLCADVADALHTRYGALESTAYLRDVPGVLAKYGIEAE